MFVSVQWVQKVRRGKKEGKKEVTVRRLAPVKGKRDGEETCSGDRKRGKGTILVWREKEGNIT